MGLWDKAAEFDKDTPKTELGLALQGLILELNSENEPSPSQHVSFGTYSSLFMFIIIDRKTWESECNFTCLTFIIN